MTDHLPFPSGDPTDWLALDDGQDSVALWLLDRVDYVENAEMAACAVSMGTCNDVLRESYVSWCRDNSTAPVPARRWGLRLNELGFTVTTRRPWGSYRPLKLRGWWAGRQP